MGINKHYLHIGAVVGLIFMIFFQKITFVSTLETFQQKVIVNSSELTIIPVTPSLFNWDKTPGSVNEIEYSARISQSPDLPEWLHYAYEGVTSIGYIYGVAPKRVSSINLDVIAWNHYDNYDVRRLVISMDVMKNDPLEFVVELKIDNLNVRDLCHPRRMQILLNVLKDQLSWTQMDGSLVVPSYLASAVAVGENRVPLRPNDAEGIIIHLSSDKDFSTELKKLQLEVSSLWKMRPCPRDMKRTSMERHFRRHNFLVDWCSFRLTTVEHWNGHGSDHTGETEDDNDDDDGVTGQGKDGDTIGGGLSDNFNGENAELGDDQKATQPTSRLNQHGIPEIFLFKQEIPERGYGLAALLATLIPGSIGGLVGFLLIALLWVDRDEDGAKVDEDALFFEAAFRSLISMFKFKNRCSRKDESDSGSMDGQEWMQQQQQQQHQRDVIIITRPDDHHHKDNFDAMVEEDERNNLMSSTPLPPQYGETHPNGAPALTYAV